MRIHIAASNPGPKTDTRATVGIDLGTTNSLVAFVDEAGRPQIISGPDGPLVPSVIAFGQDGELDCVGCPANARLCEHPDRTIYSVKRMMGRGAEEVVAELGMLPYSVHRSAGSSAVRIEVCGRRFTPPELSAFVLRELKQRAEVALGKPVARAVITVPAYFNDAQRQATKDAGRLAGLEVLRIVNEPTAAALAYGLDKRPQGRIAVYDFGGGTFDVSILQLHAGLTEVLSTGGDTHLGGDDIDQLLVQTMAGELAAAGIDVRGHLDLVQRLRQAAIELKIALSTQEHATYPLDLAPLHQGKLDFTVDRPTFEALIAPIVERTLVPCRQALKDAGLQAGDIDEVVMVGGSTRIPLVRQRVQELFGRAPHVEIDPDQVVALGAALQADIMTTGRRDMLLLDVTPLSLGIETVGGVVSKIIQRNSAIPASATEEFTTSVDNQTGVVLHVLQGERELVTDCRSLARLLIPVAPMPAGLPRVAVTFLIDANGILHVTGRDIRSGTEKTIEVKPSYGLCDEEVVRMLTEAFDHAETDIARRQFIDARSEAQQVIHATEVALATSARTLIDDDELDDIKGEIASVHAAIATEHAEPVRAALARLNQATLHLAEVALAGALQDAVQNPRIEEALSHGPDPAASKPHHGPRLS